MIPFNRAPYTGSEEKFVLDAMRGRRISGDGHYSQLCQEWFKEKLGCTSALLTPSCTGALELAALLLKIQPGDEVIMPSYTFVSTANAFVLRGATAVFVDIRPDTMNIDESLIEAAVSPNTRAILPVHYAGVGCDMDTINRIAESHNLAIIEDAAQGMAASYRGEPLGTLGQLGVYSFHETKNYTSGGEGGLLIVNDELFVEQAEVLREKGTNRKKFFRGQVDKYSWIDIGSSYLPGELQAAYLWGQLQLSSAMNDDRMKTWQLYFQAFLELEREGLVELPCVPADCEHNAHMFYLKVSGLNERSNLITYLASKGIQAVFHYVPLHRSSAGSKFGRFHGEDRYTTAESERLVRLPVWYGMRSAEVEQIVNAVHGFFR